MPDVVTWLPGLAWAVPIAGLVQLARRDPDVGDAPPASGIRLSIIIPARNESVTIETVLRSILASTYDGLNVIVVDDCSTDDTAERVATIAATDRRLTLIAGAPLPEGWRGKPWACAQGAAAATGRYLLFTDADTRHAPALLGHAVGAMERDRLDLLTLMSHQVCLTFWERVVQPQVLIVLALRYLPSRVNRATRPDQMIANGQFILMRRTAYDALGGHHTVRDEIVEDLALAQAVLAAGQRFRLMFSGALLETRMYRSLGQLVEGWSKNLYLGARHSAPDSRILRAAAPITLLLTFLWWLVPFGMVAAGYRAAGGVAIAASLLFWMAALRGIEIPVRYALAYPLGAAVMVAITTRSIWRRDRRVEWRGRVYRDAPRAP